MAKGRVPAGGKAPFCAGCGSAQCHAVLIDGGGHVWLCGSCEVLRNDPEAKMMTTKPGLPSNWPKSRSKPQKESLF